MNRPLILAPAMFGIAQPIARFDVEAAAGGALLALGVFMVTVAVVTAVFSWLMRRRGER